MKTIFTLLGTHSTATKKPAGKDNNLITWQELIAKNPLRHSDISKVKEGSANENISILYATGNNAIRFNLPSPAEALVTVYDMEGHIMSIQTFRSHKNTECLALNNYEGNYIVRVQLTYSPDLLN